MTTPEHPQSPGSGGQTLSHIRWFIGGVAATTGFLGLTRAAGDAPVTARSLVLASLIYAALTTAFWLFDTFRLERRRG